MKQPLLALLPVLLLMLPPLATAHHSRSGFDQSVSVEIRGNVVSFTYRSPHSYLVVDGVAYIGGERQSQNVERWRVESESVPALTAMGIDANTYKPGDSITVSGSPSRQEGFRFILLGTVSSLNGEAFSPQRGKRGELFQQVTVAGGVSTDSAVEGAARLTGRWVPRFVPPGTTSALPLNAAGLQAWNAYDPQLSPANTCETMGVPEIFHAPFYLYEITLTDEAAILVTEAYDIRRTVPLDGSVVPANSSGAFGNVSGRLEADALVIESSGFPASRWGLGAATQLNGGGADVPSSTSKTLVERYTVSADGRTLYYDYTLSDPVYLSAPYSHRVEFMRMPSDTPMYPYNCDPESASMFSREREEIQ